MKQLTKTLLAIFALLTAFSCQNDDADVTPPVVVEPESPLTLVVQTDRMAMDGVIETTQYFYNGAYLDRLVDSYGNEQHFHYTGDLITQIDYYFEGSFGYSETYLYDEQERVIRKSTPNSSGITISDFTYDDAEEAFYMQTQMTQSDGTPIYSSSAVYYTQNGQIVGRNDSGFVTNYHTVLYDSPFSQIIGYDKIAFIRHDCLIIGKQIVESFNYTYDGENTIEVSGIVHGGSYPSKVSYSDPLDGYFSVTDYTYATF